MRQIQRALIEMGFIIFLFYANLLMGEFTRTGLGLERGLWWSLGTICTLPNLAIAFIASFIGYNVFEFLRRRS